MEPVVLGAISVVVGALDRELHSTSVAIRDQDERISPGEDFYDRYIRYSGSKTSSAHVILQGLWRACLGAFPLYARYIGQPSCGAGFRFVMDRRLLEGLSDEGFVRDGGEHELVFKHALVLSKHGGAGFDSTVALEQVQEDGGLPTNHVVLSLMMGKGVWCSTDGALQRTRQREREVLDRDWSRGGRILRCRLLTTVDIQGAPRETHQVARDLYLSIPSVPEYAELMVIPASVFAYCGLAPLVPDASLSHRLEGELLPRHPDNVLVRAYFKSPCVPSCPAASDIEVQVTASGLVPGAQYNVAFFVKHELRLVYVFAEQVTRSSESSHDPVYVAHLHVSIPPLQSGLFAVGAVVYDAFPGLEEDESFLTRFVINVDIN